MTEVYQDWAESMSNLTLGAINYGIQESKHEKHPPSQGEFIAQCRKFVPPSVAKLDNKLSPEQIEKNKARIAEIIKQLGKHKHEHNSTGD